MQERGWGPLLTDLEGNHTQRSFHSSAERIIISFLWWIGLMVAVRFPVIWHLYYLVDLRCCTWKEGRMIS